MVTVDLKHPNQFFKRDDIKTLRCVIGPKSFEWQTRPQVDVPADGSYSEALFITDPLGYYNSHTKDCSIVTTEVIHPTDKMRLRSIDGSLEMSLKLPDDLIEILAEKGESSNNIVSFTYDVRAVNASESLADVPVTRFIVNKTGEFSAWQRVSWKEDFKYLLSLYKALPSIAHRDDPWI